MQSLLCGNRRGNYLIVLYATAKLLYLLNVICQFYLLDHFLGGGYHLYGVHVLLSVVAGSEWNGAANVFPRVTLCDFTVRGYMGTVHPHTVQCVLPVNFFSEKVCGVIRGLVQLTRGILSSLNNAIVDSRLNPPVCNSRKYLHVYIVEQNLTGISAVMLIAA